MGNKETATVTSYDTSYNITYDQKKDQEHSRSVGDDSDTEFIVKYGENVYDIKRFLRFHPGGMKILRPYRNKTITRQFHETPHSPAALYLFQDYRKDHERRDDAICEDLESLVDWSKPMLSQVGNLGGRYFEWLTSPVHRNVRLFESPILEKLSNAPWYIIPIIWLPFSGILFYIGFVNYYAYYENEARNVMFPLFYMLLGIGLWTLLEYSAHRWLFHFIPSPKHPTLVQLHFMLHGLHHKAPFDKGRLVFPPAGFAILVALGFYIYISVFPYHLAYSLGSGTILGYMMYDLFHYYLHHGTPPINSYRHHMKRYHHFHHFTNFNNGFGVTSPLWDKLFKTKIFMRKIKNS